MSRSRLARCRLGLGLPLLWALLAVLSCLNPRPDDQPLFSSENDSDGSNYSPPAIGGGGSGDGIDVRDPGSTGSAGSPASGPDNSTGVPGGSDADAGPPADAGPLDEPDAGAPND